MCCVNIQHNNYTDIHIFCNDLVSIASRVVSGYRNHIITEQCVNSILYWRDAPWCCSCDQCQCYYLWQNAEYGLYSELTDMVIIVP